MIDGHCIVILMLFSAFRFLGWARRFWVAASERDQGVIKAKMVDANRLCGFVGVSLEYWRIERE
jgi:hypothetical protein